jgi:hypothetical protein
MNRQQNDIEMIVDAFKALSNKNRLAIFEQIRMGCGKARLDGTNSISRQAPGASASRFQLPTA